MNRICVSAYEQDVERVVENSTIENTMDDSFWKMYEQEIEKCHGENKTKTLKNKLMETYYRLKASVNHEMGNFVDSNTVYWRTDDTLVFNPSCIEKSKIVEEQWNSLNVMHEGNHPLSITVIIDLKDMTLSHTMRLLRYSKYHNIVDGLRLWSTLPHKYDNVYVIKPSSSGMIAMSLISGGLQLLSPKMRQRVRVGTNDEIMDTIHSKQ